MAIILVIDEFELVRGMLRRMLEFRHHEVLVAADGLEALEILREGVPDLVMLDMDLPGRKSMDALRQFRLLAPTIPIIATSAGGPTGRFDVLADAQLNGASGVLMKPFQLQEMSDTIARALS
jgi:CheY-like chemotaxis protein